MAYLNKVLLIGNVGNDPELRYTNNNTPVVNLSIATTENIGNNESTQWHKVVFFNKLAEIVHQYVKKGSLLYVEGRITYRKYTTQTNEVKYFTEIIANNMQILSRKDDLLEQTNTTDNKNEENKVDESSLEYNDFDIDVQPFNIDEDSITDSDLPF